MDKKTASKLARQAIKLANANGKVKYATRSSFTFDFIVDFTEITDNKHSFNYAEAVKEACEKVGLKEYSDPTNDIYSDYFGVHNSMLSYNGRCL